MPQPKKLPYVHLSIGPADELSETSKEKVRRNEAKKSASKKRRRSSEGSSSSHDDNDTSASIPNLNGGPSAEDAIEANGTMGIPSSFAQAYPFGPSQITIPGAYPAIYGTPMVIPQMPGGYQPAVYIAGAIPTQYPGISTSFSDTQDDAISETKDAGRSEAAVEPMPEAASASGPQHEGAALEGGSSHMGAEQVSKGNGIAHEADSQPGIASGHIDEAKLRQLQEQAYQAGKAAAMSQSARAQAMQQDGSQDHRGALPSQAQSAQDPASRSRIMADPHQSQAPLQAQQQSQALRTSADASALGNVSPHQLGGSNDPSNAIPVSGQAQNGIDVHPGQGLPRTGQPFNPLQPRPKPQSNPNANNAQPSIHAQQGTPQGGSIGQPIQPLGQMAGASKAPARMPASSNDQGVGRPAAMSEIALQKGIALGNAPTSAQANPAEAILSGKPEQQGRGDAQSKEARKGKKGSRQSEDRDLDKPSTGEGSRNPSAKGNGSTDGSRRRKAQNARRREREEQRRRKAQEARIRKEQESARKAQAMMNRGGSPQPEAKMSPLMADARVAAGKQPFDPRGFVNGAFLNRGAGSSDGMLVANRGNKKRLLTTILCIVAGIAAAVIAFMLIFSAISSEDADSTATPSSTTTSQGTSAATSSSSASDSQGAQSVVTYEYVTTTSAGIPYTVIDTVTFGEDGKCLTSTMDMTFPDAESAKAYTESLSVTYGSSAQVDLLDGDHSIMTIDISNLAIDSSMYENALKYKVKDLVVH